MGSVSHLFIWATKDYDTDRHENYRPAQPNTIQLLLPKWPVKIQNTRRSQMLEVL